MSKAGLDKVAVLSFCGAVLGTSVWTGQAMSDTLRRQVSFKFDELATTISLECFNGTPKKIFYMNFELKKNGESITFIYQRIKPNILTVVIYKANIIAMTSYSGRRRRTP